MVAAAGRTADPLGLVRALVAVFGLEPATRPGRMIPPTVGVLVQLLAEGKRPGVPLPSSALRYLE